MRYIPIAALAVLLPAQAVAQPQQPSIGMLRERGMFCITAKRTARPGQRGA